MGPRRVLTRAVACLTGFPGSERTSRILRPLFVATQAYATSQITQREAM